MGEGNGNRVKLNVKWQKQMLNDLEVNLSEPPFTFKQQLWTLTGVAPERQTILGLKGGKLRDDANWEATGVRSGMTIMLMGTAGEIPVENPIPMDVDAEKPADGGNGPAGVAEVSSGALVKPTLAPIGLVNLGNTCYMNSTLQCLNAIPELRSHIQQDLPQELGSTISFTTALRDLLAKLSSKNSQVSSVDPGQFLGALRRVNPQFLERSREGFFCQQDAEECWGAILTFLSNQYEEQQRRVPSQVPENAIETLFGLEMEVTDVCDEEGSDEVIKKTEMARSLKCHISQSVNSLYQGLKEGLEEKVSLSSEALGRTVEWSRNWRIARLPPYLWVQYVRFYWKSAAQLKAKILRNVAFPFTLDVHDFCTEELREKLKPAREVIRDRADKDSQVKEGTQEPDSKPEETLEEGLSGTYELIAVLTHQGRTLDSGHYIAWVKQAHDLWVKFDDDQVSLCRDSDIQKLSGGADW
eukprot:CAMPEP_0184682304 /NCGR_PEP_ID=MMETSP0312-20130426/6750_1 /TAXON_ID=31354 /ORGANISM="Compsopogon coeruleus, Strain SAG 36.94" /LENGTH=468 /DNA_ID=CAMNT_0027133891 /DNA_START=187 /DNA_END=1590 /DNA_ORIENTATION=+